MNLLYVISLLIVVDSCPIRAATVKYENVPEGRMVGGHEAKSHSHPYMISLQMKFLWVRAHICGGSLLNQEWVLTAAHCVSQSWLLRWLLPIDVVAGAHDVNNFGALTQISGVKETVPHPLYEGGIGPYDVALLQTNNKFSFTKYVQPIRLPSSNYKMDSKKPLILAGWGALRTTFFIPDVPSRLQEMEVKYISYEECHEAIDEIRDPSESNPLDENAHLCTGPITGGKAACSGDSGGPLIQMIPRNIISDDNVIKSNKSSNTETDEEIPIVLGIVSWGFSPCGIEGSPTVYTNVSEYSIFIESTIHS